MQKHGAMSPWISGAKPNPEAALRLFCFPYAGGNALIYRHWQEAFPPGVEICPVQLPGRGGRLLETPLTDLHALARHTMEGLLPFFDKPFAFFGHSMGAMLGFELARLLRREHGLQPLHLFISGRTAPHLSEREPITYNLPESEFIAEVRRLNGTPKEVLEHPELMGLMIPLLRADFEVCQTYTYQPGAPLDCPITAFGGMKDAEVKRENVEAWRDYTASAFSIRMLPGDHFFLNSASTLVLRIVAQELTRHVPLSV